MTETKVARRRSGNFAPAFTREFNQLQNSIRRMFDNPLLPSTDLLDSPFTLPVPIGSIPPVEISENRNELKLSAELPGMRREDIQVEIDGDVLTIRGEKQEERTEEDGDERRYHLVERSYGAFQRSFTLPRTVDGDKLAAEFENGVLTVRLPKTTEARSRGRRIEVSGK